MQRGGDPFWQQVDRALAAAQELGAEKATIQVEVGAWRLAINRLVLEAEQYLEDQDVA